MIHFTIYDLLGVLVLLPIVFTFLWLTKPVKVPYARRRNDPPTGSGWRTTSLHTGELRSLPPVEDHPGLPSLQEARLRAVSEAVFMSRKKKG